MNNIGGTFRYSKVGVMSTSLLEPLVGIYKNYYGKTANLIIDVGSHQGESAEYLRTQLRAKKVYALEANSESIDVLKESFPKLLVRECAISNFDGEADFLRVTSKDKILVGTSSLDVSKADRNIVYTKKNSSVVTIPVSRLDSFLAREKLATSIIDILKIDIEGLTYQALVGLGDSISNIKMLHLKTERKYKHPAHKNNIEVAGFMRAHKFFLAGVFYEWGPNVQDQIWMNKSLLPSGIEIKSREISER